MSASAEDGKPGVWECHSDRGRTFVVSLWTRNELGPGAGQKKHCNTEQAGEPRGSRRFIVTDLSWVVAFDGDDKKDLREPRGSPACSVL